ncbi:MAG: tetratricopeptide repeat protein [Flavobacteriales bacterium]|jgi:tetratricopeptide (TPR) repeat protein|nr:tetratricopeptide repeat protein [Flavobacteriales bacterium]
MGKGRNKKSRFGIRRSSLESILQISKTLGPIISNGVEEMETQINNLGERNEKLNYMNQVNKNIANFNTQINNEEFTLESINSIIALIFCNYKEGTDEYLEYSIDTVKMFFNSIILTNKKYRQDDYRKANKFIELILPYSRFSNEYNKIQIDENWEIKKLEIKINKKTMENNTPSKIDDSILLSEIFENTKIDPIEIGEHLNKLPFANGKVEVIQIINDLYLTKKISIKLQEILKKVANVIFKNRVELETEIERLQKIGNLELSNVFEKIKIAVDNKNLDQLSDIYINHKEKGISILKESIRQTLPFLNHEKTKSFYDELIRIEPRPDNYYNYARYLFKFNFFNESITQYLKALELYNRLDQKHPGEYSLDIADTLSDLGILQNKKGNYTEAKISYQKALKLYHKLNEENSQEYSFNVAIVLINLGGLQSNEGDYKIAEESYKKALNLFISSTEKDSKTHHDQIANIHNNLGVLKRKMGDYISSGEAYQKALEIYDELAKKNPTKYDPFLANTLNNIGNLLSRNFGDHTSAKISYQKALEIYNDLAKNNPEAYEPKIADVLNNFGVLQNELGNYIDAEISYQRALNIFDKLSQENPDIYLHYLATALNNLGVTQANKEDYKNAEASLLRALEIRKKLTQENSKICTSNLNKTLANIETLQSKKNNSRE